MRRREEEEEEAHCDVLKWPAAGLLPSSSSCLSLTPSPFFLFGSSFFVDGVVCLPEEVILCVISHQSARASYGYLFLVFLGRDGDGWGGMISRELGGEHCYWGGWEDGGGGGGGVLMMIDLCLLLSYICLSIHPSSLSSCLSTTASMKEQTIKQISPLSESPSAVHPSNYY